MEYIECVDCGNEIVGKRREAVISFKLRPPRCLICQEQAEKDGRATQAQPALAVLSEGDDATRVVEEGWPQDDLLSIRRPRPQEDEAA